MNSISTIMTAAHRHCDELFSQAEESVSAGDWEQGSARYSQFVEETERHFREEEEVLFPAFEQASGMVMGPTQVMRAEHIQMRQLFAQMKSATDGQDKDRYLGLAETLMIIMQQHNMKEEQILYRMADQSLGVESEQVIKSMSDLQ